jgi:carbamate kinase
MSRHRSIPQNLMIALIRDLMIVTAVTEVAVDFSKPTERWLDRVRLGDIKTLHAKGQFPLPVIEAVGRALEDGGERAEAMPKLRGETGSHIVAADA